MIPVAEEGSAHQRALFAQIQAELRRREYLRDPDKWVRDVLNETTWSRQHQILESVRDNRQTAVQSCHGVGKSFIAARCACWWISCHPPGEAFVVTTAPTSAQVKTILWREIGRAHAKGRLLGRMNQTEWLMTMPAGNEETVANGRKPAEIDPSAFQGIHARYVLVIFDEACGIPRSLWNAADSLTSNEDSHWLAIGNPDDPNTEFAEVCKPGSGWNVIPISAFDSPNFTDEAAPEDLRKVLVSKVWVEEKKRKWGESSPMYKAKVLGQFPEHNADGLISMSWVRAAQDRVLPKSIPVQLSLDVGAGGDQSVLGVRYGGFFRILERDHSPDTMKTCGKLVAAILDEGAECAKVDEIGVGKGVLDRALEQDQPVVGVSVGQVPRDTKSFVNLRAEAYWHLREQFQLGLVDIDPDDDDLAAELINIRYRRSSQGGKILIESKDEMKARGMPSPNSADCMMLAFADAAPAKKKTRATWGRRRGRK